MAFKINLSGRTRINEYTPSPIIASRCGPASAFHLWSRGFDSRYELVWKSQRSTECRAGYLRVLRLQFPPTGKVDRLGFRCVYGICIILTQSHNLCIITIALSGSKYIITRFSGSEWHERTGFLPSAFRRSLTDISKSGHLKLRLCKIVFLQYSKACVNYLRCVVEVTELTS